MWMLILGALVVGTVLSIVYLASRFSKFSIMFLEIMTRGIMAQSTVDTAGMI